MSEINRYSTSAGGALQSASSYFPEGQAPSTVNDAARTVMADLRRHVQSRSPERTATYSGGTYAVTYDREVTSGDLNGIWCFIADAANVSGSATLNINATGAKDIVTPYGHLGASAIAAKQICVVAYNPAAQNFSLLSRTTYERPSFAPPSVTLASSQSTTSGTSITFTAPYANAIGADIMLSGVSTNGTSTVIIQLGDSGGVETSGYAGAYEIGGTQTNLTSGFVASGSAAAAAVRHGQMHLRHMGSNTWSAIAITHRSDAAGNGTHMGGTKTLSAELTTITLTTANGTDAFDAGSVTVIWYY